MCDTKNSFHASESSEVVHGSSDSEHNNDENNTPSRSVQNNNENNNDDKDLPRPLQASSLEGSVAYKDTFTKTQHTVNESLCSVSGNS